jgi:hypothetical protein
LNLLLLLPLNLLLVFGVISTAADSRSEPAQRRNLRLPLTFAFALAFELVLGFRCHFDRSGLAQ